MSSAPKARPHEHHLRVERTARYYTLGGGHAVSDVWFVLHGYGQLAGEFIRYFADLASQTSLIVAPEALNRYYLVNPSSAPARDRPVGATWMTREDRDADIEDYVDYLDALYAEIDTTHDIAHARVHVVGFSQGAATATRWVEHGHSRVSRLVVWGGTIPPETDLSRGAESLRGVPLVVVIGEQDQYIPPAAVDQERARLDAAGVSYRFVGFAGGHVVTRSVFPKLAV